MPQLPNQYLTEIPTSIPGKAYRHQNGVIWFYPTGKSHAEYFQTTKSFRTFEQHNQLGTKAEH